MQFDIRRYYGSIPMNRDFIPACRNSTFFEIAFIRLTTNVFLLFVMLNSRGTNEASVVGVLSRSTLMMEISLC
jgi:hypothetical protein